MYVPFEVQEAGMSARKKAIN